MEKNNGKLRTGKYPLFRLSELSQLNERAEQHAPTKHRPPISPRVLELRGAEEENGETELRAHSDGMEAQQQPMPVNVQQ